MMPPKTVDELAKEMENCRSGFYSDIKELKDGHKELKAGHQELNLIIREQGVSRKEYNHQMNDKFSAMNGRFDKMETIVRDHTNDEMETIRAILATLNTLVESVSNIEIKTDDNTSFIEGLKRQWLKYSSIFLGVVGTLSVIYWLYNFLSKNGVVFVLEKVNG
jgi:uncharacterized coiled-coil DUF342 family protein